MPRLVPVLVVAALAVGGCSAVPNMDAGSAGCQNATGIGPSDDEHAAAAGQNEMAVLPAVHGRSPAEADAIAEGAGHTVVFNTEGVCWCVPPTTGTVTGSWWGQRGALWLWVEGADVPDEEAPFLGWGC